MALITGGRTAFPELTLSRLTPVSEIVFVNKAHRPLQFRDLEHPYLC